MALEQFNVKIPGEVAEMARSLAKWHATTPGELLRDIVCIELRREWGQKAERRRKWEEVQAMVERVKQRQTLHMDCCGIDNGQLLNAGVDGSVTPE